MFKHLVLACVALLSVNLHIWAEPVRQIWVEYKWVEPDRTRSGRNSYPADYSGRLADLERFCTIDLSTSETVPEGQPTIEVSVDCQDAFSNTVSSATTLRLRPDETSTLVYAQGKKQLTLTFSIKGEK